MRARSRPRMAKRKAAKASTKKTAKTAKKTAKRLAKGSAKKAARAGALVGTLGMVTLHVNDIRRSVAFYRDVLGLRVMGEVLDTPDFGWAEIEVAPRVKLGLHADVGKMEEGARPPGGATGFYFAVADVDAVVKRLKAKGAKVVDEPADKSYGRDAYVEDPDGNVIAILTPS